MLDWFVKLIKPLPEWARYVLIFLVALPVAACYKAVDLTVGSLFRLTIGNTWTGLAYLTGRKRLGNKAFWNDETSRSAHNVRQLETQLGWLTLLVGVLATSAVTSFVGVWLTRGSVRLVAEVPLPIVYLILGYALAGGALVTHTEALDNAERRARVVSKKLNQPALF